MLNKNGTKVNPALVSRIAEQSIRAQIEATRKSDLEKAQRLEEARKKAQERGEQHSP